MDYFYGEYDVAVVGAGHAGCEAALACARLGLNTIMFTQTGWTADEAKGFIKVSSTPLRVYYGIHKDETR